MILFLKSLSILFARLTYQTFCMWPGWYSCWRWTWSMYLCRKEQCTLLFL